MAFFNFSKRIRFNVFLLLFVVCCQLRIYRFFTQTDRATTSRLILVIGRKNIMVLTDVSSVKRFVVLMRVCVQYYEDYVKMSNWQIRNIQTQSFNCFSVVHTSVELQATWG